MIESPEVILLLIIALCVPVFGLLIFYCLKYRQNNIEQWIKNTNALLVKSKISSNKLNIHSLLYGNFYDSSAYSVTLIIKDHGDVKIGQVIYNIGSITIEAENERFLVFNEGKWHFHVSVRPIKGQGTLESQIAECMGSGIFSKRFQYHFKNFGKLEIRYRIFGQRAIILKDGVIIGEWFRLGSNELSGIALVLSVDIPLIFQIILLAGPFSKRQSVSY